MLVVRMREGSERQRLMEIEKMTREEIPRVAELERQIFSMPWSEHGFYDTLDRENVIFLTAKEEGQVWGYCGIYLAADEGEITNVAVAPERRRQGIAGKLVQTLMKEAGASGAKIFILEVRVSNTGAIGLYQKLGFTPCGIRRNFYQNPKEDALVMMNQ